MSDITDSESLVQQPRSAGLAAPLALGIPHEVRLKLAKRMRAEQLRRYEEREKKQQPGIDGEMKRQNARVVAFQAKDMLMDAAQNGDTDEGIY